MFFFAVSGDLSDVSYEDLWGFKVDIMGISHCLEDISGAFQTISRTFWGYLEDSWGFKVFLGVSGGPMDILGHLMGIQGIPGGPRRGLGVLR